MKLNRKIVTSVLAVETVDLKTLDASSDAGDVQRIANFDIEVIGNDAAVTLTAKGAFTGSDFLAVSGGTFAISGGHQKIEGFALSELKFTRTGTTSYTINITREIAE